MWIAVHDICAITIWPCYVTRQRLEELRMYSKLFDKRGTQSYIPTAALVFRSYDHCLLDFASYITCLLEVAMLLYAPQELHSTQKTLAIPALLSELMLVKFSSFLQTQQPSFSCCIVWLMSIIRAPANFLVLLLLLVGLSVSSSMSSSRTTTTSLSLSSSIIISRWRSRCRWQWLSLSLPVSVLDSASSSSTWLTDFLPWACKFWIRFTFHLEVNLP